MQAVLSESKRSNRKGFLFPLLVAAAISVIIFSALGAAALAGWLPRSEATLQRPSNGPDRMDTRQRTCTDCGVVSSTAPVESKRRTSGLVAQ
jgi:hypothetical protein